MNYCCTMETSFPAESPRAIPILDKCEVLVVGGGPSGISAALGARRAGCDVVLMERFGCFGGVITTVGMETIGWYRYEGCTNDVTVSCTNDVIVTCANLELAFWFNVWKSYYDHYD